MHMHMLRDLCLCQVCFSRLLAHSLAGCSCIHCTVCMFLPAFLISTELSSYCMTAAKLFVLDFIYTRAHAPPHLPYLLTFYKYIYRSTCTQVVVWPLYVMMQTCS